MTDPLYQHAVLVTDRSGSIGEILDGMQEGLQGFIAALGQQAAPQGPLRKVTASLWDFDTEIACRHSMVPPAHLAGYVISPRGGTALLDAIAEAGKAGIQRTSSVTFDSSSAGAKAAYSVAASALKRYSGAVAMGMPSSFGYTEAERSAAIEPEGGK